MPSRPRPSGWCGAGPTTSGRRASASAPSAAARAPRSTRSRPTGPRSTCPTRASPRSPSATTSSVDLSRRDFTINALALRLPDMELIDPFDGLGDLAAGRLRTPLDPEISFGDDPLRMLRAARFAARFSLEPDPDADGGGGAHARPAVHRLRRAHPRRARQDRHGRRAVGGAVVRGAHRAWPASSCPSCRGSRSSRTRSTGTRTCWRTRSPSSTRRRPTGCCGWPRCSTTSASPAPAPSPTAA